jgi:hypothetical protein
MTIEEKAKEYCPDDAYPFGPDIINKEVRDAFIAGAKWQADHTPLPEDTVIWNDGFKTGREVGAREQKEQDMDEWLKDRDGCFWDGVEEGKKAMKQQMMKEAVETELYWDGDFLAIDLNMRELGYSEHDKVRVIICKKED